LRTFPPILFAWQTLASQESEHQALVDRVKFQQRSSDIAREGWRHYCGALADGVRDPQQHGTDGCWVWVYKYHIPPTWAFFVGEMMMKDWNLG